MSGELEFDEFMIGGVSRPRPLKKTEISEMKIDQEEKGDVKEGRPVQKRRRKNETTCSTTASSQSVFNSSQVSDDTRAALDGAIAKLSRTSMHQWWALNLINRQRQIILGLTRCRNIGTFGTFVLSHVSRDKPIRLMTDCCAGSIGMQYDKLSGYSIIHDPVNHEESFVNPVTGAHTNTVESENGRIRKVVLDSKQGLDVTTMAGYLQLYQCFNNQAQQYSDIKLLSRRFVNFFVRYATGYGFSIRHRNKDT
jgi:hypothetical protein